MNIRNIAIKYKEKKGYDYITSFISCGKLFYNFHEGKSGVVVERLTKKEIEKKMELLK